MDNKIFKAGKQLLDDIFIDLSRDNPEYEKIHFESESATYIGYKFRTQIFVPVLTVDVTVDVIDKELHTYSAVVYLSNNMDENLVLISKLRENDKNVVSALEWILHQNLLAKEATLSLCYDFVTSSPYAKVAIWEWQENDVSSSTR